MKIKRLLLHENGILYNEVIEHLPKLVLERSIFVVSIAKFRNEKGTNQNSFFIADQFHRITEIGIKQSFFQTSLSIYISFKFVHALAIYKLPKANTF